MSQQVSLSGRPKSLDALVGQEKIVARIRGHIGQGRTIKAWMFIGPTGTGKTSIARLLALSLQCTHQAKFGKPCKACIANMPSFDIYEPSAMTRIEDVRRELDGSEYVPRNGKYRVYIVDEAQRMSDQAQGLTLKYLEEYTPESTVFIICSTDPHLIIPTLQGRCILYKLRPLGMDDMLILVTRLLKRIGSELPADRLVDTLVDRGVSYPRLIAHAVEKYAAGNSPEEAAEVEASAAVNIEAMSRALVKGDWPGVAAFLAKSQVTDIRSIRLSALAYLKSILWQSPDISERTQAVATAINLICELSNVEDSVLAAGMSAALYQVTAVFAEFRH